MTALPHQDDLLYARLNQETAKMPWKDLLRYFSAGMVVLVSDTLDLIDVAVHIANDDKAAVAQWMAENRLVKVSDDQAMAWLATEAALWTVVVKPWILVQMRAQ